MTRAKFTPWRLDHAGLIVLGTPPKSWKPTPQHPQFIICQPHLYVSTDRETQKEIAALIAASPTMYAALESVVAMISPLDKDEAHQIARSAALQALSLARGGSNRADNLQLVHVRCNRRKGASL